MGPFDQDSEATVSADDFEEKLLDEFRSAWEQAIQHISPPDVNAFLGKGGLGEFSELAKRLLALDSEYRKQLAAGNTSGPLGQSTTRPIPDPADTVIGPAPPESVPQVSSASDGPPSAAFAGTVDWVPLSGSDFEPPISPYAATVLGDTANADGENTDAGPGSNGKSDNQRIAGYEVLHVLGRGGMGVVYCAKQSGLNRLVALKMILHGKHVGAGVFSRFRAEAEAVAQLQHPNIVQIYDIGTHEGLPFFSLELVDGPSLAAELADQPMQPHRAATLMETLARAMQYAHERGIVHRDLKPANILLTSQGVPKVTDFGLVKRLEAEGSLETQTGVIMGTPSYMAPEQAWGKKDVGALADVYSLGAAFYALLTGRPPFMGPTPTETVMLLRHEEPVPPSKLQPKVPRDLETICLKCLQKEPEKRYASALDLAEDLRRFLAQEPILARPVSRAERTWSWCKRNPALAWSGGIALALALCLMIGGPLAAFLINQERGLAVEARQQAEANELLALANEDFAVSRGETALTALDLLIDRVNTELRNVPGTQSFRRNILLTALNGIQELINVGGRRDFLAAKALAKLGEVRLELGQAQEAQDDFTKSHEILLELAKSEQDVPEHIHRLRLGRSFRNLARAAERLQGARAAYDLYLESLEARRKALPSAPDPAFVEQELAQAYGDLGRVALDLGWPREALAHATASLAYRKTWLDNVPGNVEALRENAGANSLLGHVQLSLGEPAKAIEKYETALPILDQLAKQHKSTIDFSDAVNAALCRNDIGVAHLMAGDPAAAKDKCEEARKQLEPLHVADRNHPVFPFTLRKLGKVYYCLGAAYQELPDAPKAKGPLVQSVRARELLAKQIAKDGSSRQDHMLSLARAGSAYSVAAVDQAAQLAKEIAHESRQKTEALYMVACTYSLCAADRERTGITIPAGSDKTQEGEVQPPSLPANALRSLAIKALQDAMNQGFRAPGILKIDPDLASVRQEPEFQKLVNALEEQDRIAASQPR